jgi:hypothetical protein
MIVSLLAAAALTLPAETAAGSADLVRKAEQDFNEGLRLRQAGEKSRAVFRSSVAAYEELLRRGASNAPLYRSLGNARLLAGDRPGAILAYRQGLQVAPGSQLLRECLEAARDKVAFPEGSRLGRAPEDLRPPWLAGLSARWAFALAVLAYALGCAAVMRWLMRRRRAMLLAAVVLLVGAAGVGALLVHQERWREDRPIVVIAADGVVLRKGNGVLFPPRYDTPLNRGVEAELLYRRGGWLQIELSGGEIGWIEAKHAVVEETGELRGEGGSGG